MRFVGWETGLRAMFHGLPPFDPETADLRDERGNPFDVEASFPFAELGARAQEMTHFLSTAGYQWVTEVFSPEEIADVVADASELHRRALPGDGRSWWGRNSAGEDVLCRVLDVDPVYYFDDVTRRISSVSSES